MAIEFGIFKPSYVANADNPQRSLNIGCSGGGGHNAAINGVKDYLCDKFTDKVEFVKHAPTPPKEDSEVTKIRLGSLVLSTWLGKLIKRTSIPVLPNLNEIESAVEDLRRKNPTNATRDYVDMLLDVYPSGYYGAAIWNVLQRQDKTNELKKLIAFQESSDSGNHATVVTFYLNKLKDAANNNKPYTEIISTQAMALPALCDAITQYNKWLKDNHKNHPEIEIHQYMTDLPTNGAVHFFPALSRLTKEQASVMKLYAVNLEQEVLDSNLSNPDYFKGLYNIDPKNNPMVRPGFSDPNNDKSKSFDEECNITYKNNHNEDISHTIKPGKKIASVMLGSQAGEDTIKYAKTLVEKGYQVFVFGGQNSKISLELDKIENAAESLIKLANQDDDAITQIMTRSDIIVTRSGGLSVMEQMAMPHNAEKQTVFVHHADNEKNLLSSGIEWEDANADGMIAYLDNSKPKSITALKTMPKLMANDLEHAKTIKALKAKNNNLSDTNPFDKDKEPLINYHPSFLAYLALILQNKHQGNNLLSDDEKCHLFNSTEDWHQQIQSIYANKQTHIHQFGEEFFGYCVNACFYYGLQQFTLSELSEQLSEKSDKETQENLFEYLTTPETKCIDKKFKYHDLQDTYTKQIALYKQKLPDYDANQQLCYALQSLIINTHWKWGVGNRQEVEMKDTDLSIISNNIPKSMVKILDIIQQAKSNNSKESWEEAIIQVKKYITSNKLNERSTFRYAKTTCAYQFFHNQIEQLESQIQPEILAL